MKVFEIAPETAMRHAPLTMLFSHRFRPAAAAGAIEWEELPSLSSRVRNDGGSAESVWDATRPADLMSLRPSAPFRDALHGGVAVREVMEPDVLRHFFAV